MEGSAIRTTLASAASSPASGLVNRTVANLPATRDLVFLPYRIGSRLGLLLARALRGGALAGNVPAAAAAHMDSEGQALPAREFLAGWRQALHEALRVTNSKSFWGMLHYFASRWAIVCFGLVCLRDDPSVPSVADPG